jgi:hypothetical protein
MVAQAKSPTGHDRRLLLAGCVDLWGGKKRLELEAGEKATQKQSTHPRQIKYQSQESKNA